MQDTLRQAALVLFTGLTFMWVTPSSFIRAQGAGDDFDDLTSTVPEERERAVDRILDRRKADVLRLLKIAAFEGGDTDLERAQAEIAKDRAIYLLGEYGAVEAVPLLIEQINFPNYGTGETEGIGPLAGYRAAWALANIGDPAATRAIIERMKDPVSDDQLRLFAHVVAALQGRGNETMGVARLTAALKALQKADPDRADGAEVKLEPKRIKNLQRLLATYKTLIARAPYYAE